MLHMENSVMLREAKSAQFQPKWWLQLLLFFCVFYIAQMVPGVLLGVFGIVQLLTTSAAPTAMLDKGFSAVLSAVENMPDWMLVLQLFTTAASIGAAIFFCRVVERRSLGSMGFIKKGFWRHYLCGYAVGAAMMLAAGGMAAACGALRLSVSSSVSPVYLLLFFIGYLVQGLAEETMVRGYLMVSLHTALHTRYAAAAAAGISSLVFAMLHLANSGITFLAFCNLLLAGLFFAIYVLRTGSIWGAAAAHSAWNFVQGHVLGVQVSGLQSHASLLSAATDGKAFISGGAFGLEGGFAVTAVLLAGICVLLFLPQKRSEEKSFQAYLKG